MTLNYREWLREHRGNGGEYVDIKTYAAIVGVPVEELDKVADEPELEYDESRGLGDTIAKITHTTGMDKLAKLYTKITGKDCGCTTRQEMLNKLFPYGVKENGGN